MLCVNHAYPRGNIVITFLYKLLHFGYGSGMPAEDGGLPVDAMAEGYCVGDEHN